VSILESTGVSSSDFRTRPLICSSTSHAIRIVKRSGEYKALVLRLSHDPESCSQLLDEVQATLEEHREPGFANPYDVTLFACLLAFEELGLSLCVWDTMRARLREELNWSRLAAVSQASVLVSVKNFS